MSALDVKKHGGLDRSWRLSCRALLGCSYLGADAASARMASAASCVMSLPVSRLWIVIRDTPRMAATCVGVPIDFRSLLYSVASILVFADFDLSVFVGCVETPNRKGFVKGFKVIVFNPLQVSWLGCEFGLLPDCVLDGDGGHGRVGFGGLGCGSRRAHRQ